MKETIGDIIKRLRKERNLTQEQLAEQIKNIVDSENIEWQEFAILCNEYNIPMAFTGYRREEIMQNSMHNAQ